MSLTHAELMIVTPLGIGVHRADCAGRLAIADVIHDQAGEPAGVMVLISKCSECGATIVVEAEMSENDYVPKLVRNAYGGGYPPALQFARPDGRDSPGPLNLAGKE